MDGREWDQTWMVRWIFNFIRPVFFAVVLGTFLGGSNTAMAAALVIVIGIEIIQRRRKNSDKFGEVARGSEVQDHTDKP